MSFILTRGGDRFKVGDPESYVPDLFTVGQTLSRIPRFNGHHDKDYTVAHHCIAGAFTFQDAGLTPAAALFLVHDAHETILGDVPSPVKKYLPDLMEYEERLEKHFMAALAGCYVNDDRAMADAKAMDRIIVAAEAQCLGLDDGWTLSRETGYKIWQTDHAPHLPSLAKIRSNVEMALMIRGEALPGIYESLGQELGL